MIVPLALMSVSSMQDGSSRVEYSDSPQKIEQMKKANQLREKELLIKEQELFIKLLSSYTSDRLIELSKQNPEFFEEGHEVFRGGVGNQILFALEYKIVKVRNWKYDLIQGELEKRGLI